MVSRMRGALTSPATVPCSTRPSIAFSKNNPPKAWNEHPTSNTQHPTPNESQLHHDRRLSWGGENDGGRGARAAAHACLLYTSDAADERSSVDLGGRRIIKK